MVDTTSVPATDNISNEENCSDYVYVSRSIIHKRKLTLEFASKSISIDEDVTPEQKLIELQELKVCCRDTFRTQVEAVMVDEIQNQKIQYTEFFRNHERKCFARTIQHFKTAIKQNHSLIFMGMPTKIICTSRSHKSIGLLPL